MMKNDLYYVCETASLSMKDNRKVDLIFQRRLRNVYNFCVCG